MNDDFHSDSGSGSQEVTLQGTSRILSCESDSFFQFVDWLSFGLTTAIALAVYLFTLPPDVTLERQGIYATGAFYAGVPHPPGYPLWTLYAWLFTELLQVSNVAWRVSVSSAVAGAVTCGLLALMVSRVGKAILDGSADLAKMPRKQEIWLRVGAGYAAGMAFGFSNWFWGLAVVGDVWPLSMLLLAWVICLLLRWLHEPALRRYLVAACFVYGLTLTNSEALATAAPGLAVMVVIGDRAIARDGFLSIALLIAAVAAHGIGFVWVFEFIALVAQAEQFRWYYISGGVIALLVAGGLALKTRKVFTEWKMVIASGSALLGGLSLYWYLPLASMTNPPVNWGYPRTVTGFFHDLTRGQYERIRPVESPAGLAHAMAIYSRTVPRDFGWIFLPPAVLPFLRFRKTQGPVRRLMLGTCAAFGSLSVVLVYFLNPHGDRQALGLDAVYFSASYLILALWTGWGLILAGGIWGSRDTGRRVSESVSQ